MSVGGCSTLRILAADAWVRIAGALLERTVNELGPELEGLTTIDAPLAGVLAQLFDLEGSTDP